VWGQQFGGIKNFNDLTTSDWSAIKAAAKFTPVSGCRANDLVTDENGNLFIIDTTNNAHPVDPAQFVAVTA
jgi:hypothetical protein